MPGCFDTDQAAVNETRDAEEAREIALILTQLSAADYLATPAKDVTPDSSQSTSLTPQQDLGLLPPLRHEVFWGQGQHDVMEAATKRHDSFLVSGPSGSGKTTLLQRIARLMQARFPARRGIKRVQIVASTAVSALQCGGSTIHSFFGIQEETKDNKKVFKVASNPKNRQDLRALDVLLIDEISRVDALLWDKIEVLTRMAKGRSEPFGGVRVLCFGDFLQLPPVAGKTVSAYAFQATSWTKVIKQKFVLAEVVDFKPKEFKDALSDVRFGKIGPELVAFLSSLSRPLRLPEDYPSIDLFAGSEEALLFNEACLQELPGNEQTYAAGDSSQNCSDHFREEWLRKCPAHAMLRLRKNARVALLVRGGADLPNGSTGRVIGAATHSTWLHLRRLYEKELNPPILTTVGKGVKTKFRTGPVHWPIVHFPREGRQVYALVALHHWSTSEDDDQAPQVSRTQIPLTLGWAMTIHRSQGQLFPAARVHMSKIFEYGQAYVALSRVWSSDRLQLIDFAASHLLTSTDATEYLLSPGQPPETSRKRTR